jgi:hypothetical protein
MNSHKTSRNIFKTISLISGLMVFISGCMAPEVIVQDAARLSGMKSIQLLPVEVHTLNFDPYLAQNLKSLTEFELQRAGYNLVQAPDPVPVKPVRTEANVTDQTDQNPGTPAIKNADALMRLSVMHARSYRDISEEDTVTVLVELSAPDKSRICSVLISESSSRDLLRTDELSRKIRNIISRFKLSKKK